MIQKVAYKPVQFDALFYDGSIDKFQYLEALVKQKSGEIFTNKDAGGGLISTWVHIGSMTEELRERTWVIFVGHRDFHILSEDEFNETYTAL